MSASSGNSLDTVIKCVGELVPDDDSDAGDGNGCFECQKLATAMKLLGKRLMAMAMCCVVG